MSHRDEAPKVASVERLLQELEVAFGKLPVPGDEDIVYDNSGSHAECEGIRRLFSGRRWQDLTPLNLYGQAEALFFTPRAFRFFLPAFVRASLLDPERADLIPDAILASLVPPGRDESPQQRKERVVASARSRGISAAVVQDLLRATEEPGVPDDGQSRLQLLDDAQVRVLADFVALLKRYRSADFAPGQLAAAEAVLRSR